MSLQHLSLAQLLWFEWSYLIVYLVNINYTASLYHLKNQNIYIVFFTLEHKIGIDLTVSSTLKKLSKNYTFLF